MTCSWLRPSRPSTHVLTSSSVASATVGANGAAREPCVLRPDSGGGYLLLAPGATAVGRGRDREGRWEPESLRIASESDSADVDMAEERARLGVVCPDLLLVHKRRRRLLRNHHWAHPCVLVARCR